MARVKNLLQLYRGASRLNRYLSRMRKKYKGQYDFFANYADLKLRVKLFGTPWIDEDGLDNHVFEVNLAGKSAKAAIAELKEILSEYTEVRDWMEFDCDDDSWDWYDD